MKKNKVRVLSGNDLKEVLTMTDCIDAMNDAFAALSKGEIEVPLRTSIEMEPDHGGALFMPVYSANISRIGVKTVMLNRDNPDKGLPFIHAMVTLFESSTGAPIAIMDGEVITTMRTGAVSGLATALLARTDANVAAIVGTGPQAETQLEAVCSARDISRAYVFARNQERIQAYADKMSKKLEIEVIAAQAPATLLEADIVCTATSSSTPVFNDSHIKKGTHINGVGSYRSDMAEIPARTVKRAKVIVDQMQGCLAEAGDLTQPLRQGLFTTDHIHGELGNVVIGRTTARENDDEITLFKSVGIAVQDLVTADLAFKRAVKSGIGQQITL
jgi:ornithine cyclodeaminase/alanine dehydrogenase-like protein (mu-crystallin family)